MDLTVRDGAPRRTFSMDEIRMDTTPSNAPPINASRGAALKPAEPFAAHELSAALARPQRWIDVVLAGPARIAANIEHGRSLGALALVLLLASTVFALPYGLVIGVGVEAWWRVIALYLGSTLICLPSLHVFSSYLGLRASLAQVAVLALTIPAVAALFSFGFAPILGFLRLTMSADDVSISWRAMSSILLSVALLAGVLQLWRCIFSAQHSSLRAGFVVVLLVWHLVFAHVLLRMASVLGLDG